MQMNDTEIKIWWYFTIAMSILLGIDIASLIITFVGGI